MQAIAVTLARKLIRAIFRAYRKGRINRDGKIDRSEVAAVARELIDLILDELDEVQGRNRATSDLLSDMRYRISQIQERMGRG